MTGTVNGKKVRVPSVSDAIYALVIVDDATRYTWMLLLKNKSDSAMEIIALLTQLRLRYPHFPVKFFHSDGGGEFVNDRLMSQFKQAGIVFTTTTANTPALNGTVERMHGVSAQHSPCHDVSVACAYLSMG